MEKEDQKGNLIIYRGSKTSGMGKMSAKKVEIRRGKGRNQGKMENRQGKVKVALNSVIRFNSERNRRWKDKTK